MQETPVTSRQERIFKRTVSPAWGYLAGLGMVLVFATDLLTPLGFAHGVLYALPILLSVMTASVRWVTGIGLAAAVLTLLGLGMAPPPHEDIPMTYVVANRLVSLVILGACLLLSMALLQWFRQSGERTQLMAAAMRKLDQNQRLLRVASEVGHLGGWLLTLPELKLYWSEQVRAIYELPPDHEPTLEEGLDYYLPEDRDRVRALLYLCSTKGQSFDQEFRIITARKRLIWVRAVGQAVRDAEGRIIAMEGALQDISGPKAMEASLNRSHERFRQLADAMPLIVWTAEPDGQVDYFSQTLIDYTGLGMGELSRRNRWLKALHREDRAGCLATWRDCIRDGTPFSVEARVLRKDGAYRWHLIQASPSRDADAKVLKWYGSAMLIHDRVELEQEARAISERLRTTLESMSDAFFLVDKDWNFAYLNGVAEVLLQRSRWDLIGHNIWEEFPEAVNSDFSENYYRAVRENRSTHFQSYFPPLDTWFEVNAYPSPRGLAVYFQNINERRRMEEQMRESQRLEALGQLTGGVAHDFNNLLTVIMGNTELLHEQLDSQPRLRTLTQITATAAQRGAELTQRLLAFARHQDLAPRTVDINALLADMNGMLQRTLGEQYPLTLTAEADLWKASIDPGQLENAILNLCLNARDAMPGGGHLHLETANQELDADYAHNHPDVTPGDYVMLAVSDMGQGIEPEHLHRVFEPFFTTKEKGKGTGLGLSMVYGFIKQSQGHINIYSEPGQGTTVRMYLPRATTKEEPPVQSAPADTTAGGAESILLVEDDDLVRANAQVQLDSLGYQVLCAANGAEALEIIQSDALIDLLFTDVIMPGGMNGRELAEAAREIRPQLKVLFTSGYTRDVISHQGRLDPGVLLLSKPYRRSELARKIREAMGHNHTDTTQDKEP